MKIVKNIKGFILAATAPILSLLLFQMINFFIAPSFEGEPEIYFYFGPLIFIGIVVLGLAVVFGVPLLFLVHLFRIKCLFLYILLGILLGAFSVIFLFSDSLQNYTYIAKLYALRNLLFIGGLMGGMSGFLYWSNAVKERKLK